MQRYVSAACAAPASALTCRVIQSGSGFSYQPHCSTHNMINSSALFSLNPSHSPDPRLSSLHVQEEAASPLTWSGISVRFVP